ncbi:MAG: 3-dehydroquinate synthase [Bacillota bacterium]
MSMTGMHEIHNSITIPFEYRVIFSDDVLHAKNRVLVDLMASNVADGKARAVVFLDQGLHQANPEVLNGTCEYFRTHQARIALAADPQIVTGGESAKRDSRVFDHCVKTLYDAGLDRHSYVVAVGGGAVLDAVGFAASVVHRGVRLIRLPSTVLSQNDAGIGVKNGIDYLGKKNFLGSFYPPHAVINDFTLLRTLPAAAWRDGTAEAVKVALIRDPVFFGWIEKQASELAEQGEPAMRQMIQRCAELHLAHIATSGDPFERGSARPLDFGHWSAHRLEQLSSFHISHGHAVAVGIAIDTLYSQAVGLLDAAIAHRILECLRRLGFRLNVAAEAGLRDTAALKSLLQGIAEFQEHLGGQLSLTMLRDIGSATEIADVEMSTMRRCCERVLFQSQPSLS